MPLRERAERPLALAGRRPEVDAELARQGGPLIGGGGAAAGPHAVALLGLGDLDAGGACRSGHAVEARPLALSLLAERAEP